MREQKIMILSINAGIFCVLWRFHTAQSVRLLSCTLNFHSFNTQTSQYVGFPCAEKMKDKIFKSTMVFFLC